MRILAQQGSRLPEIQQLAEQLRADGPAWFDDWLRRRFRYRPENEEVIRSVPWMVDDLEQSGIIEGDCDDVGTFIASVASAAGMPTRLVAIRYDPNDPEFLHVFCQVGAYGDWVRLDPTVDKGVIPPEFARMVEYV